MEKLIILFTLIFSFQVHAISIITDLDDTVKITNVQNKPAALWNALFNRDAFKGMPNLLSKYSKAGGDIFIVSASPNLFEKAIQDFINKNEIEVRQLYLRKLSELGRKEQYKLESIREILTNHPGEYILLGDDVEIDAKVYAQIKQEFPEQIKAVYIHQVVGGKDLPGTKFHSAYDIALEELLADRFTQLDYTAVWFNFTKELEYEQVFPKFKTCPQDITAFRSDLPRLLQISANQVYRRIVSHCNSRE